MMSCIGISKPLQTTLQFLEPLKLCKACFGDYDISREGQTMIFIKAIGRSELNIPFTTDQKTLFLLHHISTFTCARSVKPILFPVVKNG